MTTSKSKPSFPIYDPDKDLRPATVSIGVSLVTHEVEHLIQDDHHIEIPVDDEIVYLTVPYEIVYTAKGGADWNAIAKLVEEQEGLYRKHYKIVSVWECVPDHIADEIF